MLIENSYFVNVHLLQAKCGQTRKWKSLTSLRPEIALQTDERPAESQASDPLRQLCQAVHSIWGSGQEGMLLPPLPSLVSLLPSRSGASFARAKFYSSLSLPLFLPSPSSRPLFSSYLPFSLLPPIFLPPPSPSSHSSRPLTSHLPLTLSAPSYMILQRESNCLLVDSTKTAKKNQ